MNKTLEKWVIGMLAVVMFVGFVGLAKSYDQVKGTGKIMGSTMQAADPAQGSQRGSDIEALPEKDANQPETVLPQEDPYRSRDTWLRGESGHRHGDDEEDDHDDGDEDEKAAYQPRQEIQKTPAPAAPPTQRRPITRSRAS